MVKASEREAMLLWVDEIKEKFKPQFAIGSGGNINKIYKKTRLGRDALLFK